MEGSRSVWSLATAPRSTEVDPTLDEIELPTPKAPPKAKAPLLTPAQVPAANRDAEETVVFELEELQDAWDELAVD